jgi:hypothetical protein
MRAHGPFSGLATPFWLGKGLLGVALVVAALVGMHMLSAESEREQRIAAAERAHQELVAADQRRLAEQAREAQEHARELAARAASASAAVVTAPIALRPSGRRLPSATAHKRRLAQPQHAHEVAASPPVSDAPGGNEGQGRADDPIYGL